MRLIDAEEKKAKNTSFLSDIANECDIKFEKLLRWMLELENKQIPNVNVRK